MRALSKEFQMSLLTGDQDWWTMLSWKFPHLIYTLPCRFNKQTSLQYLRQPWEDIFDSYHSCQSTKNQTMVFHRNGCGPTPELCTTHPARDSQFWATHAPLSHRLEVHAD